MSVVEEKEVKTRSRKSVDAACQESFGLDRRVLAAHPGDSVGFSIRINGPFGHVVGVEVRGIPPSVAEVLVSPSRGVAPYTARISLTVSKDAKPGLYPFHVTVHNHTRGQAIGEEELGLLVMPKRLTIRDYVKLRRIYRYEGLGAQGALWYLIARVYENGVSFMELKRAYELVRGGPVKKATIAKILKQMIRKGLIKKGEDGRYYPLVTRPEIAFSRIDKRRVRVSQLSRTVKKVKRQETSAPKELFHEPYVAKLAFRRARKIAQKHGSLAAAYFLVYSLVGVRESGFLLLWLNAMFVYCEQKTGFCHYFYSELLHRYFRLLGLKEGIMYRNTMKYQKAIQVANRYIKKYYGSHQVARRLHYKLKKEKYIEPDDEIFNIEIMYYEDGDVGIRIWDNNMEEIEYEENVTDKPVTRREIKPAYPYEHIYEPNEETYFHRPAGLY